MKKSLQKKSYVWRARVRTFPSDTFFYYPPCGTLWKKNQFGVSADGTFIERQKDAKVKISYKNFVWYNIDDVNLETDPRKLCIMGLEMWKAVMEGYFPPTDFVVVMLEISNRLGIKGTPESFMNYSRTIK